MDREKILIRVAVGISLLALLASSTAFWIIFRNDDLGAVSVSKSETDVSKTTQSDLTDLENSLKAQEEGFSERMVMLEAYVALRTALEWSPPWIEPIEEQTLGIQYKLPGYWTWEAAWEDRIEHTCVSVDEFSGECSETATTTRREFMIRPAASGVESQEPSKGSVTSKFTSGCAINDDQEWIASLKSADLGQPEPGGANLMARQTLEGSRYPATRLQWGLPNAAYSEDVIIELPQKDLLMRAGGVDSDTSHMGRAIQQIVFETCLEIAKAIEPIE